MIHIENRAPLPSALHDTWSIQPDLESHLSRSVTMSPSSSSLSNVSPSICPTLARDSVVSINTSIRTPPATSSGAGAGATAGYSYFSRTQPFSDHCHNRARLNMTAPGSLATQQHDHLATTSHPFHTPPSNHFMYHTQEHPHYFMTSNDPHHLSPYDATHQQAMLYGSQSQPLGFGGWTPGNTNSAITHVNPQLMEPSPSRSLSPESPSETTFSPMPVQTESTPKPLKANPSTADEWYDGPSAWIRSVAESHRQRRATFLANPKAWPKGEGEPKVLQPLTDHCRYPHLWEVEEARKGLTEDMVVAKLMRKSEATIAKEYARCQKVGEEFKPPRPMNSAMAFADFRRPQWGDMYADMKTGAISTWLSAEWRALKDFKLEEFEWWSRVAKKYWDKYVEDYDYKFTRAPNGEGKGSKKKKAKAKENAAREKAMRMSAEAARRGSTRSTRRGGVGKSVNTGGLAPSMSITMPTDQHHLSVNSSPNVLGLTNLPHLTPTGTMQYAPAGYFDGITYSENSRTPSPPQLLTPLEAPHQHPPHPYSHQSYFYPTPAQMEYAHHHAQQQQHLTSQHQQHQHQYQTQGQNPQQQQQGMTLQVSVLGNGCANGNYYQPPQSSHGSEDFYHQDDQHQYHHQHQHQHQHQQHHYQNPQSSHGQVQAHGGTVPTLAPYNIPSPQ
ncbi:hypothetical protein IAU59_007029 [Kwoniella sp. CBS 9459]